MSQLTDRYLQKLSPLVDSKKHKRLIPLYDAYEDVLEIINKDDDRAREYKKKLMGNTLIAEAPQEYWDTSLFLGLEGAVTYDEWNSLPIHDRAKLRATIYLRNMADLIERYQTDMDDERKRVLDGKKKDKH